MAHPVPGSSGEAIVHGPTCATAVAVVVRAPDGRPLYPQATDAAVWQVYFRIDNKADMAKALTDATKGAATTGELPEWPAGLSGRFIKRGGFTTIPADEFDRTSWNALRAAKRLSLDFPLGLEAGSRVVLMQDGRAIKAAIISQHR